MHECHTEALWQLGSELHMLSVVFSPNQGVTFTAEKWQTETHTAVCLCCVVNKLTLLSCVWFLFRCFQGFSFVRFLSSSANVESVHQMSLLHSLWEADLLFSSTLPPLPLRGLWVRAAGLREAAGSRFYWMWSRVTGRLQRTEALYHPLIWSWTACAVLCFFYQFIHKVITVHLANGSFHSAGFISGWNNRQWAPQKRDTSNLLIIICLQEKIVSVSLVGRAVH